MTAREQIARWLDERGVTVVNALDPVDGSLIPVVHLDDLQALLEEPPMSTDHGYASINHALDTSRPEISGLSGRGR